VRGHLVGANLGGHYGSSVDLQLRTDEHPGFTAPARGVELDKQRAAIALKVALTGNGASFVTVVMFIGVSSLSLAF
jgi:hypothetical protein